MPEIQPVALLWDVFRRGAAAESSLNGNASLLDDVVRAQGSYIYDAQGDRYVDLECGVRATSPGHSHPRIGKVMRALDDY